MADSSLFGRLKRLFSTDVLIRNVGGHQLKVIDTARIQSDGNINTNRRIDRFSRIFSTNSSGFSHYAGQLQLYTRLELFRDYEAMDSDSIIASALDIYADECLHGETVIPLLNGQKHTIKQLYESGARDFWLYGLDGDNTFKPVKADRVAYNGKKKVYAITLDDGTVLRCTSNHIWITPDGKEILTSELQVGGAILALSTKKSTNKNLSGYEQIWTKNQYQFTHRLVAAELATSSNHRIVSICEEGLADVYDIVNVGDNHIFAIEAIDGSKLYTHNCSVQNEFGDVISISTTNEKVHKVLHNLFYDVLNIEFNLWPWIRNTLKYGDFFLKLNVAEKFGVIGVEPISAYEMIREENYDPEHPQKIRFRRDPTALSSKYSTQGGSHDETVYDNYEIAHFRLLTDTNFLPYGRSIVEPARKVWKQLCLMEDAMLIHRIMRAPDKRLFKIDIGNIPPNEIDAFMELTIAKMKKVPYVDPQTGDYNLKYNMQNILEDFYFPVRGSESATTVENISGLQSEAIQDIEYLRDRMLASLKIPKAYIGYEQDTAGKGNLASQDFRFARTIERIQRIIVSELYKIAIVHLYSQDFSDEDLVDFTLELTAPSTIYEKEKVELWQSKASLAGDLIEKKLFSRYWIYREVWNMHEEEYLEEQNRLVQDAKDQFRLEQIKNEGNDPVQTGQSFGTPHDIATLYKGNAGVPNGYDERMYADRTASMPKGGWPGAGRPKEPGTYGTHKHPLGWDPLGVKVSHHIREDVGIRGRHRDLIEQLESEKKKRALTKTLQQVEVVEDQTLLSEDNLLQEE